MWWQIGLWANAVVALAYLLIVAAVLRRGAALSQDVRQRECEAPEINDNVLHGMVGAVLWEEATP